MKSVQDDFVKNTTEATVEEYEYEYYDDEEEEKTAWSISPNTVCAKCSNMSSTSIVTL